MLGSLATYLNNHRPNDQDSWKIQPEDLGQMVVDLLKMHPRTLPSKIEVRPSIHLKSSPPQETNFIISQNLCIRILSIICLIPFCNPNEMIYQKTKADGSVNYDYGHV